MRTALETNKMAALTPEGDYFCVAVMDENYEYMIYSTKDGKSIAGYMMTSSNGNIVRITGHLCGEFTGPRGIPHTKASDAELWCFLWFAPD